MGWLPEEILNAPIVDPFEARSCPTSVSYLRARWFQLLRTTFVDEAYESGCPHPQKLLEDLESQVDTLAGDNVNEFTAQVRLCIQWMAERQREAYDREQKQAEGDAIFEQVAERLASLKLKED